MHRDNSETLITESGLDLTRLGELQRRPEPFMPGEPAFWDDPYISEQMLAAHLNVQNDAASRRPKIIKREVAWLVVALGLHEGDTVLDLGCGPGLYASRLARHGLVVTGVDYSRRSLAYARDYAAHHDLDITYVYQDYLTLDVVAQFDAVLLINGDFCVLSPEKRRKLLQNIRRALKPGGRFALDVFTPLHGARYTIDNHWYVAEEGFWRPGRHLVLEEGFRYPEERLTLNQYTVIDVDGTLTVYRNWFQHYTPTRLTEELLDSGFAIEHLGGDLRGGAYSETSEWIGLVAQVPPDV